jgi:hypothetical protein
LSTPLNTDTDLPRLQAEYERLAYQDVIGELRAALERRAALLACYRRDLETVRAHLERWAKASRVDPGAMRDLATSIRMLLDQAGQGPGGGA